MPLLVAVFVFSLEGVICEMIVNDVLNVQFQLEFHLAQI
jgi:hypothetical protein